VGLPGPCRGNFLAVAPVSLHATESARVRVAYRAHSPAATAAVSPAFFA
jgi:hypothetical protein